MPLKRGTSSAAQSSDENVSITIKQKMSSNSDFIQKTEKILCNRLVLCRQWILLVLVYYIVRASLIIFPHWGFKRVLV